jgi:accessory gene regulator protein AgrB
MIVLVSFSLVHQVLGFLQAQSTLISVVMSIIVLCFAAYVIVDPPFNSLHLSIAIVA